MHIRYNFNNIETIHEHNEWWIYFYLISIYTMDIVKACTMNKTNIYDWNYLLKFLHQAL